MTNLSRTGSYSPKSNSRSSSYDKKEKKYTRFFEKLILNKFVQISDLVTEAALGTEGRMTKVTRIQASKKI